MSSNGIPSKATIDAAVHAICAKDGFIIDDKFDNAILRNRMFEQVRTAKVLEKKERAEKSLRRPQLVSTLFPSLPTPEQFDAQDDPSLASAVYGWFNAKAWDESKPDAESALQRLVGVNMGNGYVLCRTKIGTVDAIYVTDDIQCIRADNIDPENKAIERKLAAATRNREMYVIRQPHNAEKYAKEYASMLRASVAIAGTQVDLAVNAVRASNPAPDVVEQDEADGDA